MNTTFVFYTIVDELHGGVFQENRLCYNQTQLYSDMHIYP